jgi:hypothetical protein
MGIFDRLASGPGNLQQSDYDNWNEMVGSAPPDRFGRAAYDAVRQVDPQEYYRHTQPGVDGTDPFGSLNQDQRGGLMGTLLQNLLKRGLGQDQIMNGAGVGTLDPSRMSPADMASVAQWAQRNQPQAFGYTASKYQNDPGILGSLLGNKALMTMAAGLGAKILMDQMSKRR